MSTPLDRPPMPAPPPPARGRRALLVALIVLVILVGGGIAGYVVAGPRLCALTEPERHGLPCDIPLPDGARYVGPEQSPPPPTGVTVSSWVFTVTVTDASSLNALYLKRLPTSGWTCLRSVGVQNFILVIASKGHTHLVVTG